MKGQKISVRNEEGPKIAVAGAGFVGTTCAYSLLIRGLASQIVIIDIDKERAEGESMDLNHGVPLAQPVKIWSGDYADCKGADNIKQPDRVWQKMRHTYTLHPSGCLINRVDS